MEFKKRKICFTLLIFAFIFIQAKAGDNPDQESWRELVTGMEFVRIPSGKFETKIPHGENRETSTYKPVRIVSIEKFWIGKYEVTNAQYRQYKKEHDSGSYQWEQDGEKKGSLNGKDQPAVRVKWEDARKFAKWLTDQNNGRYKFRLPIEEEWEYACRARTQTARYWGKDSACKYANAYDETAESVIPNEIISIKKSQVLNCEDGYAATANVGKFAPNDFGLYDMLGNVEEWCEDIYSSSTSDDSTLKRVVRGGSFFSPSRHLDCSYRSGELELPVISSSNKKNDITGFNATTGFRLVMEK